MRKETMGVSKGLKGIAVFLTLLLGAGEVVIYEASRKPVNAPIAMTPKAEVTADFWVLLPGAYHLELVFDTTQPNAHQRLKSALGDFACWDTKANSPCGEHLPYLIRWEIRSGSEVVVSGVGTERTRGGHLGGCWGRQLGIIELPAGHLTLHAIAESPLSQLSDLNPRLIITGGTGAAKSVQSPFVATVWMFWVLGRLILWYAVGLLWFAVAFVWFRYRSSGQSEQE